MNNDDTHKQHGSDETKGLEKAITTKSETGDKNTSEEANIKIHEETTISEVKSLEELNSAEDTKQIAITKEETETNLKTDTKINRHSNGGGAVGVVYKKENDKNELNNKKKQAEDKDDCADKENIATKDKDDNDNDKENIESKDKDEDKENVKSSDKEDDDPHHQEVIKENIKIKDIREHKDVNTEHTRSLEETTRSTDDSHEILSNTKGKEGSELTISEEVEEEHKVESSETINDTTTSEVNEEIDDGEFEDVEVPEGDDELIVPDAAGDDIEDDEHDVDDNDHEHITKDNDADADADADEDELKLPKGFEGEESNYSAIEPELVALEETTKDTNSMEEDQSTNDDEAHNAAHDPLNCIETPEEVEGGNSNDVADCLAGETNKEDDDDDVQFVETRNSPICIESDEDDSSAVNAVDGQRRETRSSSTTKSNSEIDKQTISLPAATIIVPKNLTVTRTSARKSTARPQYAAASPPTTVPHQTQQNKPKNFQYLNKATNNRRSMPAMAPRQVVDTIDLLDSSDEEKSITVHNKSLPQKFRTPPKRTLLAAKSVHKKAASGGGGMPNNFVTQIKRQPKKPAPPPLPPPTPQSNFLNAVQLQPAAAGCNPPAFSALLSNKSVIIPNAFYGNPPGLRGNSADIEAERRYARWLDNFITQFCNPQLVASHSCFVFLQRALKYKDFVRIKNIRTSLNINAQTATDQLNHQLMLDLRAIFLKSSKEITTHGRRFCELTCSMMQNKSVTLLVHGITSRVIMKTCNMEVPKSSTTGATNSSSSSSPSTSAASTSNNTNSSSSSRKRQLEEDEDEYVPGKNKIKIKPPPAVPVAVRKVVDSRDHEGGPKRSLRSKRAKRLDNSFSYNEDDLAEYDIEDDEEEAERLAQAEIQRKIEQKRMEAQKQRQQQAESFESAFLQAFAKSLDGTAPNIAPTTNNNRTTPSQRARLSNASTASSVAQHAIHNDAEDLLTATWIENVENEDTQIISDDDEPREHRIYKQQQQQFQRQQQLQRSSPKNENYQRHQGLEPHHWPKNTDIHMFVNSKNKDICVICKLSVQRIVHHYVNEHRGCEVYNSRLTSFQLEQLKRGACNIININIYKNGQPQYEAHCIFCQKQSRFMLPYWFQHFTMHTGEYAYRCSGCGVRKPTRSLLTQHQSQGCPQGGSVLQDYSHDVKKIRVEARICTLCNYVQLHRNNIVKHLHQQHNIKQILPKHIQTIVLLKDQSAPGPSMPTPEVTITRRKQSAHASSSSNNASYVVDDDDDDTLLFAEDALPPMQYQQEQPQQQTAVTNAQNQYYNYMPPYMMNSNHNFTWEDNDPSDDLSFMICGMLDVQMNTE